MNHDHHSRTYLKIWGTLLVLTVVTVAAAYQNFGVFNILIAMLIATIKAVLVALYFMHLKDDRRVNQVVFASSFFFLAVFVGLTYSDLFARPQIALAPVTPIAAPAGQQTTEVKQYLLPTPELVAKGKNIYAVQCVACHGATGHGDGAAAAALTPKPRDFTSGYWKQGGAPSQVFVTISKGIAGSAMSAFETLSVADRMALAHFVRSLAPNPPADTPQTLTASGLGEGASNQESAALPELPVDFAIDRLISEGQ